MLSPHGTREDLSWKQTGKIDSGFLVRWRQRQEGDLGFRGNSKVQGVEAGRAALGAQAEASYSQVPLQ